MDDKTIISTYNGIISNLEKRRLKVVFDALRELISPINDGALNDKLESLETTYKYMIKYMLDGVTDPQREKLYKTLLSDLYEISDIAVDKHLAKTASSFYYDKRRYYALSKTLSLPTALKNLREAQDQLTAVLDVEDANIPASTITSLRRKVEACQDELFTQLLVEYPVSSETYEVAKQLIDTAFTDRDTVCLAVSAITLGTLSNYDERKIHLLADAYERNIDEEVRQRALCGLIILLYIYRNRVALSEALTVRMEIMSGDRRFRRNVRNQFIQFIRTMETERISDIFTKEILPEMLKIAPGLQDKITNWDKGSDILNMADKNPDWEDLLASSGISKRLKELNDLQIEGADVLLTTFSSLKSFPFFSKIANWLRPYNKNNSEISGAFSGLGNLTGVIEASRFMCNSDKYSFALAITHLPPQQRDMMINRLPGGREEAEEIMKSDSDGEAAVSKNISNQYIQDLYRFFKLAPAGFKNKDIFAEHLNLPESALLRPIFEDEETLRIIGEYYFKKEYYGYAENYFMKLLQKHPEDAVLHQKAGYCKQMQKDYEGAISEYQKADIISSDFWTLRHLVSSCRSAGRIKEALEYCREALSIKPDNLTVEMQCGHCLLALGQYEEALKHYYKVAYLSGENIKVWRPIAWCSFLVGKIPAAESYYERILSATPTSEDYLNAGHVALVTKQFRKAVELYKKSKDALKDDTGKFYKSFAQDKEILQKRGVEDEEIAIMLDQLEYMGQ
ncbi:MAG: tetratricopeptide repeat protein [Bacteroidetes bacterium]|uniref:Tetratricopeptide repeat protein n=1 Tax=Candidatus Caccoplasma merdipullorum TaxID=2840718 RepID=A0A9D9E169_9BACT|nr:tetratricopeptide repeat protein [Candidatus Caccoplasma merdipullorum]